MNTSPMVYLTLFGSPSLQGSDGAALTGRVAQRHRVALLALLALAPAQRLSRDKLIAYLWSESDGERGRNLLNVSTYVLRSAIGDGVLVSSGDDLQLSAESVVSDVGDFESARAAGDHARAVALYKGPFLDGFFLSDAPEFERWADRERERLAASYGKALEGLADAAEEQRDFEQAAAWWKSRATLDPFDSRVALRFMQALEASGNRAGALQHASIHQRLLQQEFGTEPPPALAALVKWLRTDPIVETRATSERVECSGAPAKVSHASPASRESLAPAALAASRHDVKRSRLWVGAVALLVLITGAAAAWSLWPHGSQPARTIVVLPFVNMSADADKEYFSDGLTEEIITRLSAVRALEVISRSSAMHFKGTQKSLPQIARELRVTHVLQGSVRQSDGRVRISAQLVDAQDDRNIWAENYDRELRDIFRVQEEIAREVVQALEVELGETGHRVLRKQDTRVPEAHQLYLRGRFLWNTRTREGHDQAIAYYRRAIERDSSYADAYAGLADAYLSAYQLNFSRTPEAETYALTTQAAERALALDDRSADAHSSFANVLRWKRDWRGAEREFRRAIELNPSHATAHSWYSVLLAGWGRTDDALRESRRAYQLDPFAVVASSNLGWQCYLARDYDCAIEQYRRTSEIAPAWKSAYRGLGLAYAQKGMHAESVDAIRKAVALSPERPDFLADLAYVEALRGNAREARDLLRKAKRQPWEGFNIARAHVALGEPDSAFTWLDRSSWEWPLRAVPSDPALDPIRPDPRFAELVQRTKRTMGIQ